MNGAQIASLLWIPLLAIVTGLLYMGIARKVIARIQRRYGPPVYQNFLDTLKLLTKRTAVSHGVVFDLGPIMALAGGLLTLLFLPIGGHALLSFQGDLIVVLYLVVIAPLGMALGAGDSANPNSAIGMARGLTLMLAYEVPFVLALLAVMAKYNTTTLMDIVRAQAGGWRHWNLFVLPLSALVADLSLQGMMGKKPFDQPVAPHEIASGPMVEYGGKYLAMLQLYHAVAIFVETALFTLLFLGGGPLWTFLPKTFVVFLVAVLIHAVAPRFRIGQALTFYWKWPVLLGLLGLVWALAL